MLRAVSLQLARGEIVGLVGENGAVKHLPKYPLRVVLPDSGSSPSKVLNLVTYQDANRHGIFRVFQDPALIDNLPVYENLFFGWETLFTNRFGILDRRAMVRAARRALTDSGLASIDVTRPVGSLGPGLRQGLDIARTITLADRLGIDAPVILFDEPTTALDQVHEENFLHLLVRPRGRASVLFVSHRLTEVLRTCDRVFVLKDGAHVADVRTGDVTESNLHRLMVGRNRAENYYQEARQSGSRSDIIRLAVENLTHTEAFVPLSFALAQGEILGIAGADGSGKRRVGQAIGGALVPAGGVIRVDGALVPAGNPAAVKAGIAYVPGDRQRDGLIVSDTILCNFQLPSLHDLFASPFGVWLAKQARKAAQSYVDRLEIVVGKGVDSTIRSLSGGNQQKVLLGKWLVRGPKVLVLENPTQGVDTGAREAIYSAIRDAASDGVAVVLISDDLPELIGLSDRILIMVEGAVAGVVSAPPGASRMNPQSSHA